MSVNPLLGRRYTSTFEVSKDKVQEYITLFNEGNPFYQLIPQSTPAEFTVPPAFVVVYLFQVATQLFADPVFQSQARCVLHGEQNVEFENVVKLGDTIDTTMTIGNITSKRSREGHSQEVVELHFVSCNQHQEVVTRATTILILRDDVGDE